MGSRYLGQMLPTPIILLMRRTHYGLSRKAGIDSKLVADQLGHGIGVNIGTYTISDLTQRLESVNLPDQIFATSTIS
jgi:hypothetical protein